MEKKKKCSGVIPWNVCGLSNERLLGENYSAGDFLLLLVTAVRVERLWRVPAVRAAAAGLGQ